GIIKAATPGTGFGGRSLCLSVAEEPSPAVFEVAVQVKLEDESGAAGLVFCSDEGDAHYGFYPSAGKMRLTRFEGPDIYSWTILADVTTTAYRPRDWNQLRVRVESDRIICFINGQEVLKQEDAVLRGGRVGLCKFRNTVAEFRGFRVGADLADQPVTDILAASIGTSLDKYLKDKAGKNETLDTLLDQPGAGRRLMLERRRALERDAASLRDLEKELHRRTMTREILAELSKPEDKIDLIRCTLLLSRHDNPEIEISQYLQSFARMVAELKKDSEIIKGNLDAVKRLNRYLFEENGFHGSRHDYESRSNSYMNEVLDDREGLPITLSVLYLELASRLGIKGVCGMPLPGKFMVGYREEPEGEWMLIDAFERGQTLTVEQAALELTQTSNLDDGFLQPATKRAIILRMLRNLLTSALDGEQSAAQESIPYLNLVLALDPSAAVERITRARINEQAGDKDAASVDVLWLTENFPDDGPLETRQQLQQWLRSLRP
ncbi:MAG: transglutaminase family protein, partial [Prosthecobacter sp.]|nr:transglutaminase family protein [Prosthecobacter sp.]